MYFYPFLLLSADIERNKQLATMFHTKTEHHLEKKKIFYSSIEMSEKENEIVLSLLFLEHQNCLILTECFRANISTIYQSLQELDSRRMYEKGQRFLLILRKKLYDTMEYDPESGSIRTSVMKESNWILQGGNPVLWNNKIFDRLSEIHCHIHNLIYSTEMLVFVKKNYDASKIHKNLNLINVEIKGIFDETKAYIKLIESF